MESPSDQPCAPRQRCLSTQPVVVSYQSSNKRYSGLHSRWILLFSLFFSTMSASKADQAPVYYAGLAYIGDFRFIEQNYPLTRQLNGERQLDKALREAVMALEPRNLEVRFELADLERTETVVLAVAIERERVSREAFAFPQGVRTKLIVEATLQIMLYDLQEGTLLESHPVSFAINHVLKDEPDDIEPVALMLLERLYLGEAGDQGGLIGIAADAIEELEPAGPGGLRFQVAELNFNDRIEPVTDEAGEAALLRQRFGQRFSSLLAEQTGRQVVPFTRGYAIGHQLPGRFTNGEAFSLSLPEPDYAFEIELQQLAKGQSEDQLVFHTQLNFALVEPFTNDVLIQGDYRMGIFKLLSADRIRSDDWSAHEDSVESLFESLIWQLQSPDRAWHDAHARNAGSFQQFNKKKDLFNDQ
jgi:hypothetical protein